MQSFVSKVSSAGQVTLPKKIRDELGLNKDSYVVLDRIGSAVLVRKLEADRDTLAKIRSRVRKTGLTKSRVQQLVEQTADKVWEEKYGKNLRRR
jgi:AbrB family looped-hinge helix DNA binding protein